MFFHRHREKNQTARFDAADRTDALQSRTPQQKTILKIMEKKAVKPEAENRDKIEKSLVADLNATLKTKPDFENIDLEDFETLGMDYRFK